jgi:tetratricopeptide (TPR) repeat protein
MVKQRSMAAGTELMKRGDYRRALLEFKNAVQVMPRDAEAQYQLGNTFLATGDVSSAMAAYKRATDLQPRHAEAQKRLAHLMTVLGDRNLVEDAEKRLRTLLDASPADITALNTLAFAELKLGSRSDAIHHLEEVLLRSPQQMGSAILLALARVADQDVNGAEEVLKRACVQNASSPDAFVVLGRFYTGMNRLKEAEQEFQQAIRLQPKNAPALFYLGLLENAEGRKERAEQRFKVLSTHPEKVYRPIYGMFLFQEGRRTEAVQEFERLYQKDPQDRAARTRLIGTYQAVKRSADAEKLVSGILNRNPKDFSALLQRATLRLESGKQTEAQVDLNQVLHGNPTMVEAHFLQAAIHEKNGATLSQRQELNDTLRLNPLFLPARLALARLLTRTNAARTAMQVLDETPSEQKASLAVLVERNWIFAALGNMDGLSKGVQEGLAVQRTPDLLVQDALIRLHQRNFKGARASAEEALRAAPKDPRALELWMRSYSDENQGAAGFAKLREYAAAQPQSASMQLFLGRWLQARGDLSASREALAAAKAVDPDSTDTDLALAQLDLMESKWQDARQRITSILARNRDSITAHYWLAQVEEIQGNHKASIEEYRKVVAADPSNANALNNLAVLLAESAGLAGEALPVAQRAKELAPQNAAVADTLGWVLYKNGLYSLAVKHLEEANSRQVTARRASHLSMAYLKAGSKAQARQTLARAIKMDPNLDDVRQAQELMAASDQEARTNAKSRAGSPRSEIISRSPQL